LTFFEKKFFFNNLKSLKIDVFWKKIF